MTFPFAWNEKGLRPDDLYGLAGLLVRTVGAHLPCRAVHCFAKGGDSLSMQSCPAEWEPDLRRLMKKGRPRTAAGGTLLFLPLWNDMELIGAAVIEGTADGVFFQHSHDSLQEIGRQVSRELALLKEWSLDPVTGLFNGRAFHEELWSAGHDSAVLQEGEPEKSSPFVLTLLEVFPRVQDAEQGLQYIAKAAAYLDSLIGQYSPLYHFGAGVFAMLWREADLEAAVRMAEAVLRWLRREDFGPVRIGIADCGYGGNGEEGCSDAPSSCKAQLLLDQAWKALKNARERGPYALCTFASLTDSRTKLLSVVDPIIVDEMEKSWRGRKPFVLALLRLDKESKSASKNDPAAAAFPKKILALIGQQAKVMPLNNDQEAYVFLDDHDIDSANKWAEDLRSQVRSAIGNSISVGLASYPCAGFTKKDMVLNARKALVHTAFFGPDSQAVFDAISCNISGDVFHNRGDLVAAVREYRHGLRLDSENVNILNSLGVSYAQMNRQRQAVRCFLKALEHDADNFMALFNLGHVYLGLNEQSLALESFERALAVEGKKFDLLLQLGRLLCQMGKFKEARPLLDKAEALWKPAMGDIMLGAVQRFLGEAHHALGDRRKAMTRLERATSLNPRDAGAMSRLGEIYALEKQGDEIAVSLCRQAVDLEDSGWEHWYRLGFVQYKAANLAAAEEALRKSLRLDRKQALVAFLLAKVYKDMDKGARSEKILAKARNLKLTVS